MPEAIRTQQVDPVLSVIAYVDIGIRNGFNLFTTLKIKATEPRSFVVASHKLWAFAVCLSLSLMPVAGSSMAVLVSEGCDHHCSR